MIVLQTATASLKAVLAASTSTTQLHLTGIYYDYLPQRTDSQPRYALSVSTTLNLTAVSVVLAPGDDNIVRNIQSVTVYNADVTSATVTVKIVDGSSDTTLKKHTLTTGQSLVYEHGMGWQAL